MSSDGMLSAIAKREIENITQVIPLNFLLIDTGTDTFR
jgi:hypothetical protein